MADENNGADAPVTIKKYANRRLYNTSTSSYVTLDHLAQMVKDNTDFVVYDAKTGEDITRQVLTHIIVEEEGKGGQNLLPISFLRHLISFYGDSLQAVVPNYLDHTMQAFARNQEEMRGYMDEAMGGMNPFSQFEDMGKQNVAMFENAMKMFTPFYEKGAGLTPNPAPKQNGDPAPANAAPQTEEPAQKLEDLQSKLNAMQDQLNSLTSNDNS
jgi:polyhydroxyalkanoate synthesis repressor PhaR